MSKYYKAEDVIKCIAQYIMTDAKINNSNVCGDIEDYIEFTEAILADLPTIDIVKCEECKHWNKADHICEEGKRYKPETMADHFCSYGERIEE